MCFLNSSFICVSTREKQPQKRRTFMCIVKFCVLRTIHVCLQISLKCTSSFFECTCIPWFPTERIALTKSSCVATSREALPLSQFVQLGGRPTLTWRTCIEFISVFFCCMSPCRNVRLSEVMPARWWPSCCPIPRPRSRW